MPYAVCREPEILTPRSPLLYPAAPSLANTSDFGGEGNSSNCKESVFIFSVSILKSTSDLRFPISDFELRL
jgi:hypothetical protein